jgi:hypothetical protein
VRYSTFQARKGQSTISRVVGQFDCGRIAGLNLGAMGAYPNGCLSSDQLSGHGKIPDLAGGSIFCGPMAKRK